MENTQNKLDNLHTIMQFADMQMFSAVRGSAKESAFTPFWTTAETSWTASRKRCEENVITINAKVLNEVNWKLFKDLVCVRLNTITNIVNLNSVTSMLTRPFRAREVNTMFLKTCVVFVVQLPV